MLRKTTHNIRRKAATNLLYAPRTAKAHNRTLNTFVTINFWQFDVIEDQAFDLFAKLRNVPFQRWSTYVPSGQNEQRNGPPTYTWVFEADKGLLHLHWAVHIKPEQQLHFTESLRKWIRRLFDVADIPDGALQIKPIHNAEGFKLYMAKGIDPHYGKLWNIEPQDTGLIYGPRAGVSRNLGPAEWKPRKAAYKASRRRAA